MSPRNSPPPRPRLCLRSTFPRQQQLVDGLSGGVWPWRHTQSLADLSVCCGAAIGLLQSRDRSAAGPRSVCCRAAIGLLQRRDPSAAAICERQFRRGAAVPARQSWRSPSAAARRVEARQFRQSGPSRSTRRAGPSESTADGGQRPTAVGVWRCRGPVDGSEEGDTAAAGADRWVRDVV